ncbi:MAG: NAD+ synthase [Solirubrobacterales bacterium]
MVGKDLPDIALVQINTTVGDLEGNARKILESARESVRAGARVVVFPELCLPGYPAEDLYLRSDFIEANATAIERLAPELTGATFLVGYAEPAGPNDPGRPIAFNSAAVIEDGSITASYRKRLLPNYGVFDERRTFLAGSEPVVVDVGGARLGVTICEDCWEPNDPAVRDLAPDATVISNLSASPYHRGKGAEREDIFRETAKREGIPVVVANAVGGQDELVFDGASVAIDPEGVTLCRAPRFEEEILMVDWGKADATTPPDGDLAEVYAALRVGLRDYVDKNGFEHVGVALSGGIDSALVALLAVDALGPEKVSVVIMPSPWSSPETQGDARVLAANLGCETLEYPIGGLMEGYEGLLGDDDRGLAAENIQARIRGNIMMALSNSRGWLVLTTSNKSEASVGYSTLYGDMAGGFAPIRDVPKGLVYELTEWRNCEGSPIPSGVLERPPTAELRPGQLDQDSLPDYALLDEILRLHIEGALGPAEMAAQGLDPETIRQVVGLVDSAEYKRRQSPPGTRITTRGLGRDRRMPITNRYRPGSS